MDPMASWDRSWGLFVGVLSCFRKVLQLHKKATAAEIMKNRFIIFNSVSSVRVIVGTTVIGITPLKLSWRGHLFVFIGGRLHNYFRFCQEIIQLSGFARPKAGKGADWA
jgi:hypothetical protein